MGLRRPSEHRDRKNQPLSPPNGDGRERPCALLAFAPLRGFDRSRAPGNPNARPRLVIDGWREPPKNFSLFPTAMLSSRLRAASLRWFFRTQRGCTCTTGDPNRWSPQHSEQQDIHLGAIHRQSLSQISDRFRWWSDVPGKLGCPPVSRSA